MSQELLARYGKLAHAVNRGINYFSEAIDADVDEANGMWSAAPGIGKAEDP